MTGLAVVTTAVLLLVVFLIVNAFTLVVREVQHKRHMRERAAQDAHVDRMLTSAASLKKSAHDLSNSNEAARRLDAAMRKSIGEGIDLANTLALRNSELEALVELRRAQKREEETTLVIWSKVRDDLMAFSENYPAYLWQRDNDGSGQG